MDEITALKDAILKALRASTPLSAIVGNRIWDVPPQAEAIHQTPYIRFGPFSSQDDGPECFETSDITGQIDIYSNGPNEAASTFEAGRIARIVKDIVNAMQDVTTLSGPYVLADIRYRSQRTITASDGKTKHVPITITAIVDRT